jgi:hypothetical protein
MILSKPKISADFHLKLLKYGKFMSRGYLEFLLLPIYKNKKTNGKRILERGLPICGLRPNRVCE